jgi:putative DNA methylase
MDQTYQKTKPSFLEAGLPCSSLSAECQRDNNARQRPPQNRLHIWWARRPPTICRAAILAALLPYDLELDESVLPAMVDEPSEDDLEDLPPRLRPHRAFFERLLHEIKPTQLPKAHWDFLRAMGIKGDAYAVQQRLVIRDAESGQGTKIPLPDALVYRHPSAFSVSPTSDLLHELSQFSREVIRVDDERPSIVLDPMAGGGSIPLEAVRYGAKVYANELNPVASLVLKATIEYPAKFGKTLTGYIERFSREINDTVRDRLGSFFSTESKETWWAAIDESSVEKLRSRQVVALEPDGDAVTRDYLWLRIVPCPRCDLHIPISTNFHLVSKKGKPEASIAAFPVVPEKLF